MGIKTLCCFDEKEHLHRKECGMGKITIDRSKPFNPGEFIGLGWSIWRGRGQKDGDGLKGEEEQDKRALAITEVDLNNIRFETTLRSGEKSVKGEEKLKRLEVFGCVCLDAKFFQTLWENQDIIPEKWKESPGGETAFIFFDGTVLRNPGGIRYILYLYWLGDEWNWDFNWLGGDWDVCGKSAVLVS